jgi:hypothetical protein
MYELLTAGMLYLEIIAADPRSELRKRIRHQSPPLFEGKYINTTYEFDDGAVVVHSEMDFDIAKQGSCKFYFENIYSLIHLPNPNPHNLMLGTIYQDKYPYIPCELQGGF